VLNECVCEPAAARATCAWTASPCSYASYSRGRCSCCGRWDGHAWHGASVSIGKHELLTTAAARVHAHACYSRYVLQIVAGSSVACFVSSWASNIHKRLQAAAAAAAAPGSLFQCSQQLTHTACGHASRSKLHVSTRVCAGVAGGDNLPALLRTDPCYAECMQHAELRRGFRLNTCSNMGRSVCAGVWRCVWVQMAHLDAFFPGGPSPAAAKHAADMVAEFEQAQVSVAAARSCAHTGLQALPTPLTGTCCLLLGRKADRGAQQQF
jgi:hypothetical protein